MQKSNSNQQAMKAHRKVMASTTLNRRYVRKPHEKKEEITTPVKRSPKVKHFNVEQIVDKSQAVGIAQEKAQKAEKVQEKVQAHPFQVRANAKTRERLTRSTAQSPTQRLSARELKDQAIKKALAEANQAPQQTSQKKEARQIGFRFSFPRVVLALSCAAIVVFAIVYFVNLNMPDISLRVAAMQTGFDASYPSYVPRDFALSSITSEEGKVALSFKNQSTGAAFSIAEEKSAWDSSALLNNYVKEVFGDNYIVVKEQGLTIYISGSNAAWVNGGIFYTLKTESGSLTKKQIKSIAVSL